MVGRRPARYDASAAASSGMLAGLLAGVGMGLLTLLLEMLRGSYAWDAIRLYAAAFLPAAPLGRGFAVETVFLVVAAHLGLCLAFGLAFGLVAYRAPRATLLWSSLVYGLLVYAFMAFVALPTANPALASRLVGFVPALGHAAFGVVLGTSFESLRFRAVVEEGAPRRGRTILLPAARSRP